MNQFKRVSSLLSNSSPVPAARSMENFCVPEIRDGSYVFLDRERFEYHTLNQTAYGVWQLCDGKRLSRDIANELQMPVESVQLAVAQLGEAGLLQASPEQFDPRMHRRQALKLAAAGVIGAIGLPMVASVTGTDAARQSTCECPDLEDWDNICLNNNQTCTASCQCKSGCCCQGQGRDGRADCSRRGSCEGGGNSYCLPE